MNLGQCLRYKQNIVCEDKQHDCGLCNFVYQEARREALEEAASFFNQMAIHPKTQASFAPLCRWACNQIRDLAKKVKDGD